MLEKVVLSWSGGKDSILALYGLAPEYEVVGLLTNLIAGENRVSVHNVRRELIQKQAASLSLPIQFLSLPAFPSNEIYERTLRAGLALFQAQGATRVVFGDLFLADIRAYRENLMAGVGMTPIFPLWEVDTRALAQEFIGAGFQAILTCVDTTQLDGDFVGRNFDQLLLDDLPKSADPCGENGEFHTFVFDGPLLKFPIEFERDEVFDTQDGRFCCLDLI